VWVAGTQQVNVEVMNDSCWKCRQPTHVVTVLIFPDRQLGTWDNDQWLYYNHLVALQVLPEQYALFIQAFAADLRQTDQLVTPVNYRYSRTVGDSYRAAVCPHCDALQGSFPIIEKRIDLLHDLTSRLNGSLQYHPVTLDVDQALLHEISNGFEGCPHTHIVGWARA
jgi:hypothetical protein